MSSKVDFPAPDPPIMANIFPGSTHPSFVFQKKTEISETVVRPYKRLLTQILQDMKSFARALLPATLSDDLEVQVLPSKRNWCVSRQIRQSFGTSEITAIAVLLLNVQVALQQLS